MLKDIFRYQIWHFSFLAISLLLLQYYAEQQQQSMQLSWLGITVNVWFWMAVAVPVLHQVYVWLIWRVELYQHRFTARFGLRKSFQYYCVLFSLLFAGRLLFIIALAVSTRQTLLLAPWISYLLTALITPLVLFLFYSVHKFFTFERAFGIDHFIKDFNKPFVKKGIFRYTSNGMYFYGLMVLYIPGLLLFSEAALVVALFNHVYIWVHYYCTERPDIQVIYGRFPGN